MKKKLMALMLTAALVLGTTSTAFAQEALAPAPEPTDSGPAMEIPGTVNGLDQAVAEDLLLQVFEYTFIPEEIEAEIREELGLSEFESIERAVASYAAVGNYFGKQLTGNAKIFYDQWSKYYDDIVRTGTGNSRVIVTGLNLKNDTEFELAIDAAFNAMLKDHAELMYWLNKTEPTSSVGTVKAVNTVFPVITMYQGSKAGTDEKVKKDYYKVKPNENAKANAVKVAAGIVSEANKLGTDYEKVQYFNKRICLLTEYDYAALEQNSPYDDTYQWVDVFNKKLVVCEGYAKALKYLCDRANIGCFLVEGTLGSGTGAGNHMWNLVELEGKWYVVDCTNNDDQEPGVYNEKLLAIGYNNQYYKGYGFDPIRYSDGAPVPLNPDNVLLSANDYTPGAAAKENAITVVSGTANVQSAKVGAVVTIAADAVAGKTFSKWTTTSNITLAAPSSATTTFIMPDGPVQVTATYTSNSSGGGGGGGGSSGGGGGSSSGGGGGSSSGGGGGSSSTPSEPTIYTYDITAIASKAKTAVEEAIAKALAAKQKTGTASIVLENAKSVTPEAMKSIVDTVRTASAGKGIVLTPILLCDTVEGGKVTARLTLDPAKSTLKTELRVGASTTNQPVADMFAKYYKNTVRIVKFEQSGSFGMPVKAAVKLDLTGLNTKALRFYNYNTATNAYNLMQYPAYSIDANGYLHFTTTLGNNVIITDQALTAK